MSVLQNNKAAVNVPNDFHHPLVFQCLPGRHRAGSPEKVNILLFQTLMY